MSIKHGLLCLLAEGDTYGYHLKSEFEQRTGGTWPLNIGQVYTTLDRLVRDSLVDHVGEGEEGQVIYAITEQGRAEVDSWFAAPVEHTNPPRNELAIKFALAVHTPGVDIHPAGADSAAGGDGAAAGPDGGTAQLLRGGSRLAPGL